MSKEKQLIESLFSENVSQHKIHNAIRADLDTVHTDEYCYITELLQNANDAHTRHFSMRYDSGYLIYTNDGEPFKEDHVLRICNYSGAHQAQQTPSKQTEDKVKNIEKIGHKDVGFKTVFKFANCVYIQSGQYTFRFDEQYEWNKHSSNPVPWMITPLWTLQADFPDSVKQFLDSNKTQFFFLVKPEFLPKLAEAIHSIQNNMSTLLFLDKIESFTFIGNHEFNNLRVHITRVKNDNLVVLTESVLKKKEKWLLYNYTKDIPENIRKELSEMSEFSCPEKVKSKQDVTVTYAFEINEHSKIITEVDKTRIYTHLPTKQHCKLPYHFSAVFLLDKSRQSILENSYNDFLFYAMGYLQVELAKEIANDKQLAKSCLKVIGFNNSILEERSKSEFQKGFNDAARKIKFIAPFSSHSPKVSLLEVSIDPTNTLYEFPFEKAPIETLIHPTIKYRDRILRYKFGHEIDIRTIVEVVENNLTSTASIPAYYVALMNHLVHLTNESKYANLPHILKSKEIFFTTHLGFKAPTLLFIPNKSTANMDTQIELPRLNMDVYDNMLKTTPESELNIWFRNCGFKETTLDNVIEHYLSKRISQTSENQSLHVAVIKYLYLAHCQNIDLRKHPELQHINLVTNAQDKWKAANCCLFSREYKPDTDLEGEIQSDIFISPIYLNLDTKSPEKIKRFFQSLGVVNAIEFHQTNMSVADFYKKYPDDVAKGYTDYISTDASRLVKDTHQLVQFSYIDQIQLLGNLSYQKVFFQILTTRWRSIKEASKNASHSNTRGKTPIKSFIPYYLSNHAKFITQDGQKVSAKQSYHPKLSALNDPKIPVIDTGVELTEEQISYLEIKCDLEMDEIIRLLSKFSQKTLDDKMLVQYRLLYQLIISSDYTEDDINRLCTANILLPASNQSYQSIRELKCFDVYEDSVPIDKKWLKQIPGMTREEMTIFSNKIHIEIVKQLDVAFEYREIYDPPLKRIIDILPHFAIYLHQDTLKDPKISLKSWVTKIAELKIFYANEIVNAHDRGHKISVHYDSRSNELTYTGHWDRGDSCRKIVDRLYDRILGHNSEHKQHSKDKRELEDLIGYTDKTMTLWMKRNRVSDEICSELTTYWQNELDQYRKNLAELKKRQNVTQPSLKLKLKLPPKRQISSGIQELGVLFSMETSPASLSPAYPMDLVPAEEPLAKTAKIDISNEGMHSAHTNTLRKDGVAIEDPSPAKALNSTIKMLQKMASKRAGASVSLEESETRSQTPPEQKKLKSTTKNSAKKKKPLLFEPIIKLDQIMDLSKDLPTQIEQVLISEYSDQKDSSTSKKRRVGNMAAVKAMSESQVDQRTRDSIGVHGESICYRRIFDHYRRKYKTKHVNIIIREDELGFSISNQQNEELVRVDWHDKPFALNRDLEKSTRDHDILIKKPKGYKYIEVKSTIESEKRSFTLSSNELIAMSLYGDRYRLLRVLAVMSEHPKIEVLENPMKLLEEDKISGLITSMEINYSVK